MTGKTDTMRWVLILLALIMILPVSAKRDPYATPRTFREAKPVIYSIARQMKAKTLYCGCDIRWIAKKKGVPDLASCGYKPRKRAERAARIEIEHIVPAHTLAHKMACWKKGGRKSCKKNASYNAMSGDLYNLWPAVGEINGDRSNYGFGLLSGMKANQYGKCAFKTDFKRKTVEPPTNIRGMIARTWLYMAGRYGVSLDTKERQMYESWHRQYPVSGFERTRAQMIARYMKHENPYVK